jgi:hypothetical protein
MGHILHYYRFGSENEPKEGDKVFAIIETTEVSVDKE